MDLNIPISVDENVDATSKKAKRFPKRKLAEFIEEALQLEKKRMAADARRFTGTPLNLGPGWPYWDFGTVSSDVSEEMGQPEDSIREIKWRLKQFRYPYRRLTAKYGKTFYQHAKTLGVLDSLLGPPLLSEIRSFWCSQKISQQEHELNREKKSEYGLPMAHHHELLFQLAALLTKIEKLIESHEAEKDKRSTRWLETILEYRKATLKQILHEAAIVYPQVQYRLIPARQLKEKAERVEAQVALFTGLDSSFKGKGVQSHQFAYHLVSLFFSSKKEIVLGKLKPTPVTVRRNIEGWKKKPTIQGSGKIRKATR